MEGMEDVMGDMNIQDRECLSSGVSEECVIQYTVHGWEICLREGYERFQDYELMWFEVDNRKYTIINHECVYKCVDGDYT